MKWVTRERARVDRIACPGLISRFIENGTSPLRELEARSLRAAWNGLCRARLGRMREMGTRRHYEDDDGGIASGQPERGHGHTHGAVNPSIVSKGRSGGGLCEPRFAVKPRIRRIEPARPGEHVS